MASDILGQAWNISEKGQEIITENNTINNKATILKNALNTDLKEIGAPVLNKILTKNNLSQVVLQIQKIRNISAPKANENSHAAPRMLKLVLTDGDSYIQAIETAPIPSLSLEKTPPGAKILIHSAKISSGYVLLDSTNCSLLGGQVPALFEKWELARSVQHYNRQNSSSDGPPAWVNFGCKVQSEIQDKPFKSLDNKAQEKENTKFDLQRQDAIAEATSGAVKKVFGGGVKQVVQAPVPKYRKNDVYGKEKKNSKSKFSDTKEMDDRPQKPSERVSLFDFLEDKLPLNENNVTQTEVKPVASNVNPRNVQTQPNYAKRNNYNQPTDQGSSYRIKSEGDFQISQSKIDRNMSYKMRNESNSQSQSRIEKNHEVNGFSNNLEKMSLNTQFASRSLKQHLNLGPQKKNSVENTNIMWKVGDDCVAKYWEDGKFYNATITAITDRTCVVKFKGYGNIEEVLKNDCLPVSSETSRKPPYTGPMEFRRSVRTYRRQ